MSMIELLLIAVGLSMDAFAVSTCKGLAMPRVKWGDAVILGFAFGLFQALMPVLGYFLGTNLQDIVAPVDHWIVFGLLGYIGGSMIWEAVHEKDEDAGASEEQKLKVGEVLALAIATSIDAFATGISFALLDVDIVFAVVTIGIITFTLSIVGVWVGSKFGSRWERGAQIAGGVVLICIGLKVLLEHLGILVL